MGVAIITGASSGIGKEFFTQMLCDKDITEFWLVARRTDLMKELVSVTSKKCKILTLDLSSNEGLNRFKEHLVSENPQISYLVNAAGYGKYGDYTVVDTNTAFNIIDLNVKALLFITEAAIPYMLKGSHIIQIGSASTYHPLPNLNVYAASKSFVKHYSRALHRELKPKNISVTTVCPGWVKTDFFGRANIDTNSEKSFAKPMSKAKDVVKKALKDAKRNKDVSMYGAYNNLHHAISKLLPHSLMIKFWQKMQKQ